LYEYPILIKLVENVEEKIKNWLLEEQQTITKKKEPTSDFLYVIANTLGSKYSINIAKIKDRDLIQIVFGLNVNDKTKKELLRKVKKKSSPLLNEINEIVLMKGASFAFVPNLEDLKQISVFTEVFPSELTKTSLFDAIRLTKDVGILVMIAMNKHVETEDTSASTGSTNIGIG